MSAPLEVERLGAVEDLGRSLKKEKRAVNQIRVRAVLSVAKGERIPAVAKAIMASERAIRNWVHRYNREGLAGILDRRTGRICRLGEEDLNVLKKTILFGPKCREEVGGFVGEDVRKILKEEFDVQYSLDGIYYLMHNQLNLSHIKPRPMHRKADAEKQDAFKKTSLKWLPL